MALRKLSQHLRRSVVEPADRADPGRGKSVVLPTEVLSGDHYLTGSRTPEGTGSSSPVSRLHDRRDRRSAGNRNQGVRMSASVGS